MARSALRLVIAVLAALGLAGLAYHGWLQEIRSPVRRAGAMPLTLVVPAGMSSRAVGERLHALGLVRHPLIFRLLVARRGVDGQLRAGEYRIEGPVSLEEMLERLVRGDVVRRNVTFPEGKNLEEMAQIVGQRGLDSEAFLEAARDPSPIRDLDPEAADLEGYLFPDTYELPHGDASSSELVARMVRRFREVMGPEIGGLEASGLSLRELTTLASLVELETARAEERPLVAAVFHNRLRRGMLLQADPTVIYALRLSGRWDGNIRKKDLSMDSPYNTYRYPGLPPGPIAAPGREALMAALNPASVGDLYFVSRNDGSHQFSKTLSEHERAVDRYQRSRRRRPERGS